MVRVESYEREHWEIPLEEKQTMIAPLKQKGDVAFRAGEWTVAKGHYLTALAYIGRLQGAYYYQH